MSAVDLDLTQSNPILAGASSPLDAHIGAQNYFDLAAQWIINKNFTVRGGVNNIADRDPPVVSSTAGAFPSISGPALGNGNTFPQVYDTLGRAFIANGKTGAVGSGSEGHRGREAHSLSTLNTPIAHSAMHRNIHRIFTG